MKILKSIRKQIGLVGIFFLMIVCVFIIVVFMRDEDDEDQFAFPDSPPPQKSE